MGPDQRPPTPARQPRSPSRERQRPPAVGGDAPRFRPLPPQAYSHDYAAVPSAFPGEHCFSAKGSAGFCPPHTPRYEILLPRCKYPQPGPGHYSPSPQLLETFPAAPTPTAKGAGPAGRLAAAAAAAGQPTSRPCSFGGTQRFFSARTPSPGPGSYDPPSDRPVSHLKNVAPIAGGYQQRPAQGVVKAGVWLVSRRGTDHPGGPGSYDVPLSSFDFNSVLSDRRSHNVYYTAEAGRRHRDILSARHRTRRGPQRPPSPPAVAAVAAPPAMADDPTAHTDVPPPVIEKRRSQASVELPPALSKAPSTSGTPSASARGSVAPSTATTTTDSWQ
eukprot:EG_transcript_16767